jgi:hypothetical protein
MRLGIVTITVALAVGGCGVNFQDSIGSNSNIPSDFTKRTFFDDSHSVRFDLANHLGSLWIRRLNAAGEPTYKETTYSITPTAFTPHADVPLSPAKASSQVDSSFASKGAYAPLIAGDLQGKQTLEFTLIDSLEAVIPENQIPNSQIDRFHERGK